MTQGNCSLNHIRTAIHVQLHQIENLYRNRTNREGDRNCQIVNDI